MKKSKTLHTCTTLALVILLLPLLQGWFGVAQKVEQAPQREKSIWEVIFTPYIL